MWQAAVHDNADEMKGQPEDRRERWNYELVKQRVWEYLLDTLQFVSRGLEAEARDRHQKMCFLEFIQFPTELFVAKGRDYKLWANMCILQGPSIHPLRDASLWIYGVAEQLTTEGYVTTLWLWSSTSSPSQVRH